MMVQPSEEINTEIPITRRTIHFSICNAKIRNEKESEKEKDMCKNEILQSYKKFDKRMSL